MCDRDVGLNMEGRANPKLKGVREAFLVFLVALMANKFYVTVYFTFP